MNDFSIELTAQRIVDVRSRDYFREVYLSYSHGNYRSAIVMLWTVIVCDVLFKLEQLSHGYGDATATQILKDIQAKQQQNPKSPEWEAFLIEAVHRRTELLDIAEFKSMESIQSTRHLCAHPIVTPTYTLATINQDTARAHIRNGLEAILTKPPIMSKSVFDTIMVDIESLGQQQPSEEAVSRYISERYLKHLRPTALRSVFRSLWRVVFKSSDPRAEQNRAVNLMALSGFFASDIPSISNWISEDRSYFSDIAFGNSHTNCLTHFLRTYSSVFSLLTEAATAPLRDYSKKSLDHFACCWFISNTAQTHVDEILSRVSAGESLSTNAFQILLTSLWTDASVNTIRDIGIQLYGRSHNYDTADRMFAGVIRLTLNELNEAQITMLLQLIESNSQTYDRRGAFDDHQVIKAVIDARWPEMTLVQFPRFKRSIGIN